MPAFIRKPSSPLLSPPVLLAIALPILVALIVAHWASMQRMDDVSSQMAHRILMQADRIRIEMSQANRASHPTAGQDPCSPQGIQLMRGALLHADTLADVGYVRDDQLLCSALGQQDLPIGKPAYTSLNGFIIRNVVHLPIAQDVTLLATTDPVTGISMFTHPAQVMDIIPDGEPWSAAVVGTGPDGAVLASRGRFDPEWLKHPASGYSGVFLHKRHIVAWERSRRGAYTVFAAMPNAMWAPVVFQSTLLALALGLVASLLLVFAVRRMALRNTSLRYLLKQAIKQGELSVAYQPVVELASGRWVGAEALMRWHRPRGESISPDIFIPIAEESGLMPALGEHLLRTIERETTPLFTRYPDFQLALNFSAEDLCASGFPARLKLASDRTGAKPRNLHVEVTERVFMHLDDAAPIIASLQGIGISVVIDDFGTGYSSLSYLTHLQFDWLKIDKSFVGTVETGAVTSKIVDHIIAMSKSLGIQMIAEGVENQMQADYLREHGVQYAQGWLYAKAMPITELLDRMPPRRMQSG